MRLDRRIQRRIFARSLLLQAAWDYQHMQGLGFAFSLSPWLRRLYPHADERRRALKRHLEFFNTQPYMAGIALGVAAHQEEVLAQDPSPAREVRVAQMKRSLGSALAAIGDPLFWGVWRPLCATLCATTLLLAADRGFLLLIVAGGLILYNVPVWAWRWKGIRWGYEEGERVTARLSGMGLQRGLKRIRWAGLLLTAFAAAGMLLAPPPALMGGASGWPQALPRACILGACLLMKRAGWSSLSAYGALTALSVGAALVLP